MQDRELEDLQKQGSTLVGDLALVDSLKDLEDLEGMFKAAQGAAQLKGEPTNEHFDAALKMIEERKSVLKSLFPETSYQKTAEGELLKSAVEKGVAAASKKTATEQQEGNFGAAGLEAMLNEDAALEEDSGVSDDGSSISSSEASDEGIDDTFRSDILAGRSNIRFEVNREVPIDLKCGDKEAGANALDAIRRFTKHPKGQRGLQLLMTQKGVNGGASAIMNGSGTQLIPNSESQHLFQLKKTEEGTNHVLIRSAFMVRDMSNPEKPVEVPTQTVVEFELGIDKVSQEFRVRNYELRVEFPT